MKGARTTRNIILTIVGIAIAVYVLFPFYLVVMNSFKNQASIVASPVSLAGASFSQLMTNLDKVINNSNFQFWYAFGTSAVVTIISLILLALFGGMAAWVISRNNKKMWATVIYMIFIASMIIPFQVVMLPLISTRCGQVRRHQHASVHPGHRVRVLRFRRGHDRVHPDRFHQGYPV